MNASNVLEILDRLAAGGVEAWLDGGWGVDALLQIQSREHDDLDLVVRVEQLDALRAALAPDFAIALDELPARLVLGDGSGRRIDLHPVRFDDGGGGVQTHLDGSTFRYPPEGFVNGRVGDREVPCLSARVQVLCHTGYPPDGTDRHDVLQLAAAFDVRVPEAYRVAPSAGETSPALRLHAFRDGGKIPWHDPAFGARMLGEHLSQEHDAASRRADTIERQVEWLCREWLGEKPGWVLDLGCGPGLYCEALAARGHRALGIDFSPASIEHARAVAARRGSACEYRLADLRDGDYGEGLDLALLVHGELNTFPDAEAASILRAAHGALRPGGWLVLEVSPRAAVAARGRRPQLFWTASGGLFAEGEHAVLRESAWLEDEGASVERWWVIHASGRVERLGSTTRGWRDEELTALVRGAGFEAPLVHPALDGGAGSDDLVVLAARRPE